MNSMYPNNYTHQPDRETFIHNMKECIMKELEDRWKNHRENMTVEIRYPIGWNSNYHYGPRNEIRKVQVRGFLMEKTVDGEGFYFYLEQPIRFSWGNGANWPIRKIILFPDKTVGYYNPSAKIFYARWISPHEPTWKVIS